MVKGVRGNLIRLQTLVALVLYQSLPSSYHLSTITLLMKCPKNNKSNHLNAECLLVYFTADKIPLQPIYNCDTVTETDHFTCGRLILGVFGCDSDLQHLRLGAQAFGAELHDRVGAECVSDFVLTERAQPHRQRAFQLQRRDKDGLVT